MNSRKTAHFILLVTVILTVLSIISPRAHALTVENVTFAESIQDGPATLPLHNAALLRYLKFIKAYVAALYLSEGVNPDKVLSDVPKRLELHYLVPIKGPDFGKVAEPIGGPGRVGADHRRSAAAVQNHRV